LNDRSSKPSHVIKITLLALAALSSGCAGVVSSLKASAYYDTRELASGTITGSLTQPKHGTRFFGFTDLETESEFPRYVEAQVSQRIVGRLGGIVEYNRDFNSPEGTVRFGGVVQLPLPAAWKNDRFTLKYTPLSTNSRGGQVSVAGTKALGPDMSIDGFFDYNVRPGRPNAVVTDWQFGRRLKKSVFAVAEYRYSRLRPDRQGVGIGLEWRIK
jgi:hypothetical protein